MSGPITCFALEPTDRAQEYLRRIEWLKAEQAHCPASHGGHSASVAIGEIPLPGTKLGDGSQAEGSSADDHSHDDPRWPTHCACGLAFSTEREWLHGWKRLYRRSDSGELVTIDDAPAGAMWFADWYGDAYRGPDGRTLVVKTPVGEWIIDAKPSGGGASWQRTGTPPKVTARPSILFPNRGYHAWLTDVVLVPC